MLCDSIPVRLEASRSDFVSFYKIFIDCYIRTRAILITSYVV